MSFNHMFRRGRAAFVAVLAAAGLLAASAASAQDAASFYKGKTARIVVGYGPGGGYDAYARMLAPHLAKALGATVIVENQPGAGGLVALNRLAATQPDGLTIMIVNGTAAALSQLLDQGNVRYDLAKLEHLGIVSASPWVWLVNPNFPVKTPADAMRRKEAIRWSATGPSDGLGDGAALTCEALKLNCKVVMGYKGSSEAALAVFRGEMDAIFVSDTSANNYAKNGQAVPVATMGRTKSRFFPNVPTIFEAVKLDKDQAWWFDFRANLDDLGRIFVAPAGVPADRAAYLRAAMRKVLTDPAVIAEGQKSQRYIEYRPPEEARDKAVALVGNVSPEQRKRIAHVLTKKYH